MGLSDSSMGQAERGDSCEYPPMPPAEGISSSASDEVIGLKGRAYGDQANLDELGYLAPFQVRVGRTPLDLLGDEEEVGGDEEEGHAAGSVKAS